MIKSLNIAWKDILMLVRDRAAMILMLAAPFALTLGLGAVSGGFSSSSAGIGDIPVIVINQDLGALGEVILHAFDSEELSDLFTIEASSDLQAAHQKVESDQVAALVLIPPGFSASLIPDPATGKLGSIAPVQIITSPERPNSANILQSVVTQIINQIEAGRLSRQLAIDGLLTSGRIPANPDVVRQAAVEQQVGSSEIFSGPAISIHLLESAESVPNEQPNILGYLAPAMAVFFLMYTVSQGGRSILIEREYGTLARMLTTATTSTQVLGGKVFGIFIAGVLQVGTLVLTSAVLFGLRWGNPLAVGLLILTVCLAATGWGLLLASLATSPWQVGGIGSALMLIFGLLGGSFVPVSQFSAIVRKLAWVTPNYWSNTGFLTLMNGGDLADILPTTGALLLMAVLLFLISVLSARQRWATGFAKK